MSFQVYAWVDQALIVLAHPIAEAANAATIHQRIQIRGHSGRARCDRHTHERDVRDIGTHDAYGRVVLLRSGTGFVIIADRLEALRESYDHNHVLQAVAHWADAADKTDRSLRDDGFRSL